MIGPSRGRRDSGSAIVTGWSSVVGRRSSVVGRWSLVVGRWLWVDGHDDLAARPRDQRPTTDDRRPQYIRRNRCGLKCLRGAVMGRCKAEIDGSTLRFNNEATINLCTVARAARAVRRTLRHE